MGLWKTTGAGALVVIVAAVGIFLMQGGRSVYSKDTIIRGNFSVKPGEHITLTNNAHLSVEGNMSVDGVLSCSDGSLSLSVSGKLTVNGKLYCILNEGAKTLIPNSAISLAAKSIEFGKDAEIGANGHVMIVSNKGDILENNDNIERVFNESGENTGGADARIGPFVAGDPSQNVTGGTTAKNNADFMLRGKWHIGDDSEISADMPVPSIPKNAPLDLIYISSPSGDISFEDLTLTGPKGNKASDDINASCNAKGSDGVNGARMRVIASHISITNTSIHLGDGGDGGNAEAILGCAAATATGGSGGMAGNLKMTAGAIAINNFTILPGKGGRGGDANAIGKDGTAACPGTIGGSAVAHAGNGSPNKEALSVLGNISGIEKLTVGRADGGDGGRAVARGGDGGAGNTCGCGGGVGGDATATGGDGGDTLVITPQGGGEAHGGDGGDTKASAGRGGTGGSCANPNDDPLSPTAKGGVGGDGGKSEASAGRGGIGTTATGNQGKIIGRSGGTGGSGGEACAGGIGGKGGVGFPIGENGSVGRSTCVTSDAPNTEPVIPMIKAILYHNKYLPVDQLIVAELSGCDEKYWRSRAGEVTATDGSIVPDSLLACGFGKIKETPTIDTLAQAATATPIRLDGQ